MIWEDFLFRMQVRTGCPKELVRIVLEGMPEVLMEMEVDERTWTPLGYFKMHHRKPRMINYFGNKKYYPSPEVHRVKLKPGDRLERTPPAPEDESTIEFIEESDPDMGSG